MFNFRIWKVPFNLRLTERNISDYNVRLTIEIKPFLRSHVLFFQNFTYLWKKCNIMFFILMHFLKIYFRRFSIVAHEHILN